MSEEINTRVRERLALLDEAAESLEGLSKRESEIVAMAAVGMSDREIAELLEISGGTLGTYWSRIRQKTGFRKRTEVIAASWRHRHILGTGNQSVRTSLESGSDHILFSVFLERLEVPVAVWNPEGVLIDCNTPFREIAGLGQLDKSRPIGRGSLISGGSGSISAKVQKCQIKSIAGTQTERYEARFLIRPSETSVSLFFALE